MLHDLKICAFIAISPISECGVDWVTKIVTKFEVPRSADPQRRLKMVQLCKGLSYSGYCLQKLILSTPFHGKVLKLVSGIRLQGEIVRSAVVFTLKYVAVSWR